MPNNFQSLFFSISRQTINLKNNGFAWIRLFLALVVVISHSNYVGYWGKEYGLPIRTIYGDYTTLGTFAVFGFFIISGFLITASFVRSSSIIRYFTKRILRIMPGYWACLVVTVLVFGPMYYLVSGRSVAEYFIRDFVQGCQYIWNGILLDNSTRNYGSILDKAFLKEVNGPLWSLIFEFKAYTLLGILGIFGFLKNKFLILIPASFFWICSFLGLFDQKFLDSFQFLFGDYKVAVLFSYFFIAAAFYVWQEFVRMDWKFFTISSLMVIISIKINNFSLFAPFFGTYCLLYIAHKVSTPKFLDKFGDMSYGVYIYSWPIQNLLMIAGLPRFGLGVFTFVSVVLSLIAGYLSYHLIEKRFLVNNSHLVAIAKPN